MTLRQMKVPANSIHTLVAAAALCLALLACGPAFACSMSEEYVRPSDFELVQLSDAIVVATARQAGSGDGNVPTVAFDVTERVKGAPGTQVEVYGEVLRPLRKGEILVGYSPEGHQGICEFRHFRLGHRYLIFLERFEGGKMRAAHVFSRADENYSANAETWLRMVRRYVALQAEAQPMEQLTILERMLKTGRDQSDVRLKPVELDDLRYHLSSPTPYKPTPFLLATFDAVEHGKPVLPAGPGSSESLTPPGLDAQRRQILLALVNGNHPDARPLFERLVATMPQDPSTIGLALRYFARNGAYQRAFAWIETRLMNLLPLLEERAARRLVGDVAQAQGGPEGEERWRSDPHAAAVWPELALALYWYQVRAFRSDDAYLFSDAVAALPHADLRARPLLTLALGRGYEQGISEWAVAELRDVKKRQAWESLPEAARENREDPASLPLQVLLSAWRAEDGKVLEEVFCQSEPRRLALIRTLGESGDALYQGLLENIGASPLSQEARDLVALGAVQLAVRERTMIERDDVNRPLLLKALQRERLPGAGLSCPAAPVR